MEYPNPRSIFGAAFKWLEANTEKGEEILLTHGASLNKVLKAMKANGAFPGVTINEKGRNVIAKTISKNVFAGKPKREVKAEWVDFELSTVRAMAEAIGVNPDSLPEYGDYGVDDFTNPFAEE